MKKTVNVPSFSSFLWFFLPPAAFILWLVVNVFPPGHVAYDHLQYSIQYAYTLMEHPGFLLHIFRDQPVKYPPLAYLSSGVALLATDFSFLGYLGVTVVYWCIALLGMLVLGRRYTAERRLQIVPALVLLGNPWFWKVGFYYILETTLAAATVLVLLLFKEAEKRHAWIVVLGMCILAAFLPQAKAVFLIPVIPGMLALCFSGEPRTRRLRFLLLAILLASAACWLLPKWDQILPLLRIDFAKPPEETEPLNYADVLLLQFRGLPLIAALSILLVIRIKKRDWTMEDTALGLFFLAALLVFSIIDTKKPWYILPGAMALPLWFVLGASRQWESKRVRQLSGGLIVVYLALTLLNTASAIDSAAWRMSRLTPWSSLPMPHPPTADESALVEAIDREFAADPSLRLAVDLDGTDLTADRLMMLLYLKRPTLALREQLAMTDRLRTMRELFVPALPHSHTLLTGRSEWPAAEADRDLAEALSQAAPLFVRQDSLWVNGNLTLSVFVNQQARSDASRDLALSGQVEELLFLQGANLSLVQQMGEEAYQQGDFDRCLAIFTRLLEKRENDHESRYRIAKCLLMKGDQVESAALLNHLLAGDAPFDTKMNALNFLADQEALHLFPAGTFAGAFQRFAKVFHGSPEDLFTLHSIKLRTQLAAHDWPAALETSGKLRSWLRSEQIPGFNLNEAAILLQLNEREKAELLLRNNLAATSISASDYSESALRLVQLAAEAGDFRAAGRYLESIEITNCNPANYARTCIILSGFLEASGQESAALSVLQGAFEKLDGEEKGLVLIEIGKIHQKNSDLAGAEESFRAAQLLIEGEALRQWLDETLHYLETSSH